MSGSDVTVALTAVIRAVLQRPEGERAAAVAALVRAVDSGQPGVDTAELAHALVALEDERATHAHHHDGDVYDDADGPLQSTMLPTAMRPRMHDDELVDAGRAAARPTGGRSPATTAAAAAAVAAAAATAARTRTQRSASVTTGASRGRRVPARGFELPTLAGVLHGYTNEDKERVEAAFRGVPQMSLRHTQLAPMSRQQQRAAATASVREYEQQLARRREERAQVSAAQAAYARESDRIALQLERLRVQQEAVDSAAKRAGLPFDGAIRHSHGWRPSTAALREAQTIEHAHEGYFVPDEVARAERMKYDLPAGQTPFRHAPARTPGKHEDVAGGGAYPYLHAVRPRPQTAVPRTPSPQPPAPTPTQAPARARERPISAAPRSVSSPARAPLAEFQSASSMRSWAVSSLSTLPESEDAPRASSSEPQQQSRDTGGLRAAAPPAPPAAGAPGRSGFEEAVKLAGLSAAAATHTTDDAAAVLATGRPLEEPASGAEVCRAVEAAIRHDVPFACRAFINFAGALCVWIRAESPAVVRFMNDFVTATVFADQLGLRAIGDRWAVPAGDGGMLFAMHADWADGVQ